ncbi:MAG: hypothetical protein D6743_16735, partial [Calditrichaeota bacterium]
SPAFSQSFWDVPDSRFSLRVEALKPLFDGDTNTSFSTGVLFFSVRLPLTRSFVLVGDLPVGHRGYQDDFGVLQGQTAKGNPYLGIEVGGVGRNWWGEVGIRPTGIPEDRFLVERVGEGVDLDRFEGFVLSSATFVSRVDHLHRLGPRLNIRARAGVSAVFIGYDDSGITQLFFDYGVQGEYDAQRYRIILGFLGRLLTNQNDPDLHQFGISAAYKLGFFEPGATFLVPLGPANGFVDSVFGLSMTVRF